MNELTNAGKYVEVLDGSDSVRVTVRASRSVFSDFTDKNLVATADVSEMEENGNLVKFLYADREVVAEEKEKFEERLKDMRREREAYLEYFIEDNTSLKQYQNMEITQMKSYFDTNA